jgi:hypothetical protein
MHAHLGRIAESYPHSDFGPLNRTTARDLLAAAKLTTPEATPNDVVSFLVSKFRDKRPYPYENGLRKFGGMIIAVREDFAAWHRSQPQGPKEIRVETEDVAAEAENASTDSTKADGPAGATVQALPTIWENPQEGCEDEPRAQPAVAGPCSKCSGKGYYLDDTGREHLGGEEFKTLAAAACHCSKGREIGYRRLTAIERKAAERLGVGWIPAHRPRDQMAYTRPEDTRDAQPVEIPPGPGNRSGAGTGQLALPASGFTK